jgi:hypothetical protein
VNYTLQISHVKSSLHRPTVNWAHSAISLDQLLTLNSGTRLPILSLSLNLMLRPTVSRPVCLGIKHPSGAYDQILITVRMLRVCWCGALSLTRVRVCRWDSWPYFTDSDSRPPFSSPPTTRRATVEVFDPASTRGTADSQLDSSL